jgi:hypothetical protein
MTAKGNELELDIRSSHEAELIVDRTDISFEDLDGETVTIRVKIRNESCRLSEPTFMRLESAPFGAFVPWQPLAVLPVPPIEPGASRELSIDVKRPHPAPLGNFDLIPPRALLAAVSSPDEPPPRKSGRGARPSPLLRQYAGRFPAPGFATKKGSLPPDLWDLVGRRQPHWAGNINVFVGARAVERHLATALRVYPGRPNLAMFVVGDPGRRDAYAFDFVGLEPDWRASLHNATGARTLSVGASERPVQETRWVEALEGRMVILMKIHPPAGCQDGKVEVHVTRRSCEKTAVVEFNLDPTSKGPGCYSV